MSKSRVEEKGLVMRALVAASGCIALLGPGVELATEAVAKAREAVEKAGATARREVFASAPANSARARASPPFAAWAGPVHSACPTNPAFPMPPATGVRDANEASAAVLAATSAAGSFAKGDLDEARRLARNALRFATVATGGEVDWTVAP